MSPETCIALSIIVFASTVSGYLFGLKMKTKEAESLREQRDEAIGWLDQRDDEIQSLRGVNDRMRKQQDFLIGASRKKTDRIETLEKENQHLRVLILDAKNILVEG
jgi:cell shape-determining protein MreC